MKNIGRALAPTCLVILCGTAWPQQIDAKHPSVALPRGSSISLVAISDFKLGKSWDISGHVLPKVVDPSLAFIGKKPKAAADSLFLVIEVREPNIPFVSRHDVRFMADQMPDPQNRVVASAARPVASAARPQMPLYPSVSVYPGGNGPVLATQYLIPVDSFRKSKSFSFSASIAIGPGTVLSSYKATSNGVEHEGYDFAPKVAIQKSGETIFIGKPPAGMTMPLTSDKQYELVGFDENGNHSAMSWSAGARIPASAKDLGVGKIKALRLTVRKRSKISFVKIPLAPSK